MIRRFAIAAFAASVLATPALAQGVAPLIPSDKRMKILMYDENDIYAINTRYGYQTSLVFSAHEEIQIISVGDRSLWQIIPSANRLFIRPMDEGVSTNMTILTNKRAYQFDLKAAQTGKESEVVYVAKFIYPEEAAKTQPEQAWDARAPVAAVTSKAPPPDALTAAAAPPAAANYNYTFTGPDALAPLQVYDDGRYTYVKLYDQRGVWPDVLLVKADNSEVPVVHTVKDGALIIETVAARLALRYPSGTILIYNETLNP